MIFLLIQNKKYRPTEPNFQSLITGKRHFFLGLTQVTKLNNLCKLHNLVGTTFLTPEATGRLEEEEVDFHGYAIGRIFAELLN